MATLNFTVMNRFIQPFVDGHIGEEYKGSGIWRFGYVNCDCGVKGHANFVIMVYKADDTGYTGTHDEICISNEGKRVCSHGHGVEDLHASMILQFFKTAKPQMFCRDVRRRIELRVDARED